MSGDPHVWAQHSFSEDTPGRGTYDITSQIQSVVSASKAVIGMCHVFVSHTSASLMLCENADPDVRRDLETWMSRQVVDGDPEFVHTSEGPDDMSAHIRTMLTGSTLSIPISAGTLGLGTWQGIYLWEHRSHPQRRNIVVTVQGTQDNANIV